MLIIAGLICIVVLQAVTLVVVICRTERKVITVVRKKDGAEAKPIWEVLRKDEAGNWNHDGWVRENTRAWLLAEGSPGLALRRSRESEIHWGVQ